MRSESDPSEREPRLARRSPFAPATKLCPRCLAPLKPRNELGGWLVPQDYVCTKCGYARSVYLENDADLEKGAQ